MLFVFREQFCCGVDRPLFWGSSSAPDHVAASRGIPACVVLFRFLSHSTFVSSHNVSFRFVSCCRDYVPRMPKETLVLIAGIAGGELVKREIAAQVSTSTKVQGRTHPPPSPSRVGFIAVHTPALESSNPSNGNDTRQTGVSVFVATGNLLSQYICCVAVESGREDHSEGGAGLQTRCFTYPSSGFCGDPCLVFAV